MCPHQYKCLSIQCPIKLQLIPKMVAKFPSQFCSLKFIWCFHEVNFPALKCSLPSRCKLLTHSELICGEKFLFFFREFYSRKTNSRTFDMQSLIDLNKSDRKSFPSAALRISYVWIMRVEFINYVAGFNLKLPVRFMVI